MQTDKNPLRLIDANINRACEGLRVAEDLLRFYFDDEKNSVRAKEIRHCLRSLFPADEISKFRESRKDVGKNQLKFGSESRGDLKSLFISNFKRAEEAVRVIEELSKLRELSISLKIISEIEAARFEIYDLEKETYLKYFEE